MFVFIGQSNAERHFYRVAADTSPGVLGVDAFEYGYLVHTGRLPGVLEAAVPGSASNDLLFPNNSNIQFWWNLTDNEPGQALLDAIALIDAAIANGELLEGFIWSQGETEARAISSIGPNSEMVVNNLTTATEAVFQFLQDRYGNNLPIYIQELGDFPEPGPFYDGPVGAIDAVRDAQNDIISNDADVFLGAATQDITSQLSDGVHFTVEGYEVIGERLAATINANTAATTLNIINGSTASETLSGTSGDNLYLGFGGDDVFLASNGDDVIANMVGEVGIYAIDQISDRTFVRNTDGSYTVSHPTLGTDTLHNIGFIRTLNSEGQDFDIDYVVNQPDLTIEGTSGDDVLTGNIGDDTVRGNGGSDTFRATVGNDTFIGGADYDQVNYGDIAHYTFTRNLDDSVTVIKPDGTDTLVDIDGIFFSVGGWRSLISLAPLLGDIDGTSGDDVLIGTEGPDTFNGNGGNDVYRPLAGDDTINGGPQNDQVNYSGAVTDYVFTINADQSVTVTGQEGTDTLINIDSVYFLDEAAWYALPTVITYQGPIEGTSGDDTLIGTIFDDTINGNGGVDTFIGSTGNDTINGDASVYDQVNYSGGVSDYTFARVSSSTVTVNKPGGESDSLSDIDGIWFNGDSAFFNLDDLAPDETPIDGTSGDDLLVGNVGNNIINGLGGNDTLLGREGDDELNGGEGFDQANFEGDVADFTFTRTSQTSATVESSALGTDTLNDIEALWFSESGWFTLDQLAPLSGPIDGTAGDDILTGTVNDDTINGLGGDDSIRALAGDDIVRGGGGNDLLDGGTGDDTLNGGNQDDTLVGMQGNDILRGGAGFDQANYFDTLADMTFTRIDSNTVEVSSATSGTDTLTDIEAIWISNDGWFAIEDLIPQAGQSSSPTNAAMLAFSSMDQQNNDDTLLGLTDLVTI